jgi:hypothetical protein
MLGTRPPEGIYRKYDAAEILLLIKALEDTIQYLQESLDYARSVVRNREYRGQRQEAIVRARAVFEPRTGLRCTCHGVEPRLCASVQAGEAVRFESVELDPRLKVELKQPRK